MTRRVWDLEFGIRLRRARKNAGATQDDLGDHLALSRSTIANIECGRQAIYAHNVVSAAQFLRVDVGWLLQGDGAAALPPDVIDPKSVLRQADALLRIAADLCRVDGELRALADTTTVRSVADSRIDPEAT